MKTDERIVDIQADEKLRSDFIKEYTNFILSSARKAAGKYVDKGDDEFSIAMIAFDEAITRYSPDKGGFLTFAACVIHSRIIDDIRKNKTRAIPFSSLERTDRDGSSISFDAVGDIDVVTDTGLELHALKAELNKFDISFFELPKCSPKTNKTKREVFRVISFIVNNADALKIVKNEGIIPSGMLTRQMGAGKKLLERHRKYIIAAVIILDGDYPASAEYIRKIGEVN